MGNGALYMEDEEDRKDRCGVCGDKFTSSYWLRTEASLLIEACPECHHYYVYAPKDILEQYKKRRGIK